MRKIISNINYMFQDTGFFHWTNPLFWILLILLIPIGLVLRIYEKAPNFFNNYYFELIGYRKKDIEWLVDWVKSYEKGTKHMSDSDKKKNLPGWYRMHKKVVKYIELKSKKP